MSETTAQAGSDQIEKQTRFNRIWERLQKPDIGQVPPVNIANLEAEAQALQTVINKREPSFWYKLLKIESLDQESLARGWAKAWFCKQRTSVLGRQSFRWWADR